LQFNEEHLKKKEMMKRWKHHFIGMRKIEGKQKGRHKYGLERRRE